MYCCPKQKLRPCVLLRLRHHRVIRLVCQVTAQSKGQHRSLASEVGEKLSARSAVMLLCCSRAGCPCVYAGWATRVAECLTTNKLRSLQSLLSIQLHQHDGLCFLCFNFYIKNNLRKSAKLMPSCRIEKPLCFRYRTCPSESSVMLAVRFRWLVISAPRLFVFDQRCDKC